MQKSITILFVILLLSLIGLTSGADTPLAQAFAALTEGENANYAAGKCVEAIGFIGPSQGVLDWSATFHHDPKRGEIQVLGKVQQPYATARHIMFSEASETWRIVANDMFGSTSGHPYYSHTLDPATGDMYYVLWGEDYFRRYTRSSDKWDYRTAADIYNWQNSPPVSAALHPALFTAKADPRAIVVWARAPVFAYSLQDEKSYRVSAKIAEDQGSAGGCVYSPAMNAVVFCGGNTKNAWRVDPGDPPTYKKIASLPVIAMANARQSILTVHPASGLPMIIERYYETGEKVWVYDPDDDSWDLQAYKHPFGGRAIASTPQFIVCTLPAYGGMAALYQNGEGSHKYDLNFHIWKVPAGGTLSVEDKVPAAAALQAPVLDISPNPFNSHTTINLKFKGQSSKFKVQIYSISGKLVADLKYNGTPINWNPTHLPGGLYLLKARIHNEVYTKQLFLVK